MSPVDQAAALLSAARMAGARSAEALVAHTEAATTTPGARVVHRQETRASIRVWMSPGEVRVARGDTVQGLLDAALAAPPSPDPFDGPIATGASVPLPGLLIEDRRWAGWADGDREALLNDAINACRAAGSGVDVDAASLRDQRTVRAFASSRGVRLAEGATRFDLDLALRGAAQGRALTLRPGLRHRSLSTLYSLPIGVHAARRFADLRRAPGDVAPPSACVLAPGASAQLLVAIAPLFLDPELGSGFLARSALDPRVIVIDDGSLPGGYATRSFDDRGVPPGPVTLVRDGRSDRLLLSAEAARAAVRSEPGHDVDGRPATSNLVWAAGVRQMNAILIERTRPTCWIDGFSELTVDLATGVARGITHVELLIGNEPQGCWLDASVELPLADCLARLIDLGADTDRIGPVDAPAVWVEGATVVP